MFLVSVVAVHPCAFHSPLSCIAVAVPEFQSKFLPPISKLARFVSVLETLVVKPVRLVSTFVTLSCVPTKFDLTSDTVCVVPAKLDSIVLAFVVTAAIESF